MEKLDGGGILPGGLLTGGVRGLLSAFCSKPPK